MKTYHGNPRNQSSQKVCGPSELVQEDIRHRNLPLQHHIQGSSDVGEACCVVSNKKLPHPYRIKYS
jgi:hypothetical protein